MEIKHLYRVSKHRIQSSGFYINIKSAQRVSTDYDN